MGLTANIKELEGAINNLTDNGRWLALEHVKALLESSYAKTPKESTWTGYYRGIEKEGNIIFPEWG